MTASPDTLTTVVIEDQQELREGLQLLINGTPGHRCTGTYRSMEDALARLSGDAPQIVLVDIGLPGMSGIEGIPLLRQRFPTAAVLVLSVYDDDERIFAALCAGASGTSSKRPRQRACWRACTKWSTGALPCPWKWRAKSSNCFANSGPCHPPDTI